MRISDGFRKRALFGVAIFCITAIATVGALSIGGNEEEGNPDSLVDLNETDNPDGTNQQVADNTGEENQPDVQNPDQQVADNTGDNTGTPEVQDPSQVADNQGDTTQNPEVQDPSQVADNQGDTTQNPEVQDPSQVADHPDDGPDNEEQTEVLSPQLIAEQLNFDKTAGLLWPLSGEVLIPYSPDHAVFHYTLEQFGVSDAIVLSSTVGTEVKAAAKGVVTSIEEDVRTGTTVTLALGSDVSLVYGQLDVAELEVGDVVEAGECIGTVAEPTRYYVVEGANLYFQVLEDGESIDPTGLLQGE